MKEKIICEERTDEGIRFFKDGCCGTIRTIEAGGDKRVIEVKVIGQMDNTIDHTFESANRVYDKEGLSPTINTCGGGGLQPKVIVEDYLMPGNNFNQCNKVHPENGICRTIIGQGHAGNEPKVIVASRGRNPDNPSDRKQGIELEQRLEPNSEGICNTLTSVQKDNLVLEPKLVGGLGEKDWGKQWRQGNRVYDADAIAMALQAQPVGNAGGNSYLYKTDYRIRKLTPKECWRLMGFTDEDFYKAEEVNSNTQLYKQAGNSIVVDVLEAIFKQML